MNIEDVAENCTLTPDTLSIPGIQLLHDFYLHTIDLIS
jgi:hypothetical protein